MERHVQFLEAKFRDRKFSASLRTSVLKRGTASQGRVYGEDPPSPSQKKTREGEEERDITPVNKS